MNDLSFIRLEPKFNDAKNTRYSPLANLVYYGQIVLRPNETYTQTTNTKEGIAFNGNYKVTIIDCNEKELQNITDNIAISEFIKNGLPQISFEVTKINTDYYAKTVFLKFEHTVSNYVWYSNPLNITNMYDKESSRFDYKNATDAFYQSIVLRCLFTVNDAESNSSEYTTQYGRKETSRMIRTEYEQYFFDKIDNFTYRRLNDLLGHDVVFINGNRVTTKQTLPSKPRVGNTNTFNIDFKVPIDYNETFTYQYQIFSAFDLITFYPASSITLAGLVPSIQGSFNRDVVLGAGTLKLFKDGDLFETFTENDILISDNNFSIDITGIITENGSYYINFTTGLFNSVFSEVYEDISSTTDWSFTITDGEYDNTQYNNDYLIN